MSSEPCKSCAICLRQKEDSRSSHLIFEDNLWVLRHSAETNILGYLILESRRHFLDLSEALPVEAASFGLMLKSAIAAVRSVIEPERVYTFTLAEVVPHFHVHIIPRTDYVPRAYRGRGVLQYPLTPVCDPSLLEQACRRIGHSLAVAEQTAGS